jgi:hypothetical protein
MLLASERFGVAGCHATSLSSSPFRRRPTRCAHRESSGTGSPIARAVCCPTIPRSPAPRSASRAVDLGLWPRRSSPPCASAASRSWEAPSTASRRHSATSRATRTVTQSRNARSRLGHPNRRPARRSRCGKRRQRLRPRRHPSLDLSLRLSTARLRPRTSTIKRCRLPRPVRRLEA